MKWRRGREVEGSGLENRRAAMSRRFESYRLRHFFTYWRHVHTEYEKLLIKARTAATLHGVDYHDGYLMEYQIYDAEVGRKTRRSIVELFQEREEAVKRAAGVIEGCGDIHPGAKYLPGSMTIHYVMLCCREVYPTIAAV